MPYEQVCAPFEIKSVNEDERTFAGVVACYHNIDLGGDIFDHKAFDRDIAYFVANGVTRDEHQVTTGKITDAKSVSEGLYFTGKVSKTPAGDNQMTLLRDGVYKFLSVGQRTMARSYLEGPEAVKSYWEEVGYTPSEEDIVRSAYGARLITRSRPYEASTTFAPMNERTSITSVKSASAGGRRFVPTLRSALETVEELVERAAQIKSLRSAEGRDLSSEAKALLSRLVESKARLIDVLSAIEEKSAPPDAGVPEGEKAEPTAVLRPELSDEFNATLATLSLLGVPL